VSSRPSAARRPLRLLAGLALPLIAFLVLLRVLGNATGALAITDAIPILWLVAFGIWRRRIEPIALIPAAVFGLALLLSIAFGGSSLPLELRRSVFPGAVGLACLASLAARRPLLTIAATKAADARAQQLPAARPKIESPGARRTLSTLTAIIGVACVADAAAQITLALTVSTTTFAVVARIASYAIIGTGLAACAIYLRFVRAHISPTSPRRSPPARCDSERPMQPDA
jgi:hypothetical protein